MNLVKREIGRVEPMGGSSPATTAPIHRPAIRLSPHSDGASILAHGIKDDKCGVPRIDPAPAKLRSLREELRS